MTPRERIIKALNHEPTDIIPFSIGFGLTFPALKRFAEYMYLTLNEAHTLLTNCSDTSHVSPRYIGPPERNTVTSDNKQVDIWGVVRHNISYGDGEYSEICGYPLSGIEEVSELVNYLWPDTDWFDFSVIPGQIDQIINDGDRAVISSGGNIFETSWYMRGFETMLGDLLVAPEIASEIMERVTKFFIDYQTKILTAAEGGIDMVFTADDIGGQTGLLMSLDLWEKMIKPHHAKLNRVIHSFGAKVLYHTDGSVMEAVPGLIDMGIDILEALQFDAFGMDPEILKKQYGEKLCFHGGVSVQSTLPFGTVNDVKNETTERIRILGRNSGYILAPSHAIQAGTPPQNIEAFLKAAGRL
ncbi:MAG: uroporphyrinogen decarboxylase family protein [Eubacteriales bacterium]